MRPSILTALVAALLGTAACDEGTTAPATGLDMEDLALVALDGDAITGAVVFAQLFVPAASPAVAAAQGDTRDFSLSRPCAAGGSIEIVGVMEREWNGEGTVEATLTGTRSQVDCTRTRGEVTIVINGTGTFEAYRKRVDGEPVGNQTTSYAGSFTWVRTRGDETREGSCDYALESVRQPDAMKVSVTGTMCGHQVDRERDWHHGS